MTPPIPLGILAASAPIDGGVYELIASAETGATPSIQFTSIPTDDYIRYEMHLLVRKNGSSPSKLGVRFDNVTSGYEVWQTGSPDFELDYDGNESEMNLGRLPDASNEFVATVVRWDNVQWIMAQGFDALDRIKTNITRRGSARESVQIFDTGNQGIGASKASLYGIRGS